MTQARSCRVFTVITMVVFEKKRYCMCIVVVVVVVGGGGGGGCMLVVVIIVIVDGFQDAIGPLHIYRKAEENHSNKRCEMSLFVCLIYTCTYILQRSF